jgi:REP element-mobilizing transposase RayT
MKHRHLPHLDIKGYYQFITFRTHDSVDGFLKKLAQQNQPNNHKQLAIDNYLDGSAKGAYLHDVALSSLYRFLQEKDTVLYELIAFAIMPNHVHLLLKPLENLATMMQKIKGGSAKVLNQILNKQGRFWAQDYYDRLIRDERHFYQVYNYIRNNPIELPQIDGAEAPSPRFYGIWK